MKKILVPTDFSLCAAKALDYAVELAKKDQSEIILFHSCDLLSSDCSYHAPFLKEYHHSRRREYYQKLYAIKDRIENTTPVAIDVLLYDSDDITDNILAAAEDTAADLIVMGTHGDTGNRAKAYGSNAASIINQSEIPVVTVPYSYSRPASKDTLLQPESPF